MSDLVERAEQRATGRAWVLYLLAATVVASSVLSVGARADDTTTLGSWLVMVALVLVTLSPLAARFPRTPLTALLEDETTRDHRRSALEAGFWAGAISAVATVAVAAFEPLSGPDVGRVVLGAALAAALGAFATLELRAAR